MDDLDPRMQRAQLLQDFLLNGWLRVLPSSAILLVGFLQDGAMRQDDVGVLLGSRRDEADGWTLPAWEPPPPVDKLDADDERTAAQIDAEELEFHESKVARVDQWSTAMGRGEVRTNADLLEFMVSCGVLVREDRAGTAFLDFPPALPLPDEVLSLTEEERAREDDLRWRELHEPTAQQIMRLFEETDDAVTRRRTSLERLAREVDADPESARAGVGLLLADGDFTASRDVATLATHEVFELAVDWERHHAQRIGLQIVDRGEGEA